MSDDWKPFLEGEADFSGLVHGTFGGFETVNPLAEINVVSPPKQWWSLKRKVTTYTVQITQYDEDWDGALTVDFETTSMVPTYRYIWRWQRG